MILTDYQGSGDEDNYEDGEGQMGEPMMDTGSDVMLDYPSDCFKESCYEKCPMCAVSYLKNQFVKFV